MIRAYNRAFVNTRYMLPLIGVSEKDFRQWIETTTVPYTLIKNRDIFIEKMSFSEIIRKHGTDSNLMKWNIQIRHENLSRTLTKTEKIRVAADQQWKCARCKNLLPAAFEVDHVEQWSLRKTDSLPLQALCANCHREKSYDDISLASCYFGERSSNNLKCDERNRDSFKAANEAHNEAVNEQNIFSSYFHH